MGVSMDFSGIGNPDELDSGGEKAKPGRGMVMITNWNEHGAINGKAHKLEVEIVAWSDEASVGVTHAENIFHEDTYNDGSPQKKMAALGVAAGLFTPRDILRWQAGGEMPEIDFYQMIGRPIMIQLEERPDKNDKSKTYINVGKFGKAYYHVKDERVKDWPKNIGVLNNHASKVGDYKPTGGSPPSSPASGDADPFANA